MLYTTLLAAASAAVAAAAPAQKNHNEFTIRPLTRTDLCIDVQPAEGETTPYALIKPCRKENGRYVDSQTFYWDTLPLDYEPLSAPSELLHSKYQVDGAPGCLWSQSPDDSPYPGVVPSVAPCPAKDSEEYTYFRWSKQQNGGLGIYRPRGLRPWLRQIELTRDDTNQTNLVGALKSANGKDDMRWAFIKV